MGFFSRIGNKIGQMYNSGSRLGMKTLGSASRIGHKVSEVGHTVLNAVKNSPIGLVAATPIALAEKVLGGVDKGTAFVDKAIGYGNEVNKVVKAGRSALERKSTAPVDAGLQAHPSGDAGSHLRDNRG